MIETFPAFISFSFRLFIFLNEGCQSNLWSELHVVLLNAKVCIQPAILPWNIHC
jgi:hypothetical protein